MILKNLRTSVVMLLMLTVITGLFYPLLITAIAQLVFPTQANGTLILKGGRVVGSALIGQPFTDPGYFWSRPSATASFPYNAGASSGSNLGPLNPVLLHAVHQRVVNLKAADPSNTMQIPVDLVTSSGSGLDPHISVMAALYQVPRVARTRGLAEEQVRNLAEQHAEGRQFGVLGEPRINVLLLNLALDETIHRKDGE